MYIADALKRMNQCFHEDIYPSMSQASEGGVRRSLKEAARILIDKHALLCIPDEPLVIGPVDEFDDDRDPAEKLPYTIWIANGIIQLLIKCPGEEHSAASDLTGIAVFNAFETANIKGILPMANVTTFLTNNMQGQASFAKEDDGNIHLSYRGKLYRLLTIEAGFNHEDIHTLLCEASAWLHSDTCTYAIAIKRWAAHPERGLCFMVFKRIHGKNEQILPPSQFPRGGARRFCGRIPDIPQFTGPKGSWSVPKDPDIIRDFYDMELVQIFYARSADEIQNLQLDLHFMFESIAENFDYQGDRWLVVNLVRYLRTYFESFRETSKHESSTEEETVEEGYDIRRRSKRLRGMRPDSP